MPPRGCRHTPPARDPPGPSVHHRRVVRRPRAANTFFTARVAVMKGSRALRVYRVEDVPLKEVSGVCLRRGPGGELSLVAIGDRAAVAAWFVQPADDTAPIEWRTADVAGLEGSRLPKDDSQIEAVCADGAGRVLLLQEWPTRTELIDPWSVGSWRHSRSTSRTSIHSPRPGGTPRVRMAREPSSCRAPICSSPRRRTPRPSSSSGRAVMSPPVSRVVRRCRREPSGRSDR